MEKFCYKCGALEEEKGPLMDGLCRDCFLEENPLIKTPREIELEVCDRCGAYFLEGESHDVERDPTSEYVEAAKELLTSEAEALQAGPAGTRYVRFENSEGIDLSFEAEYTSPENIVIEVGVQAVLFDYQEEPLTDRVEVEVNLVETRCDVCSKLESGYYEAVLQVRGKEDLDEDKISEVYQALKDEFLRIQDRSRDEFVSQVKRKHGGMDIYTSSSRLAEDLARFLKNKYGGSMDKSAELIGQTEDGEERYRVTVVARLPF